MFCLDTKPNSTFTPQKKVLMIFFASISIQILIEKQNLLKPLYSYIVSNLLIVLTKPNVDIIFSSDSYYRLFMT